MTGLEKVMGDLSSASLAATVALGHKLGFYQILASPWPHTADNVAVTAGTNTRMTEEWLKAQVAGGYVTCEDGIYRLPDELVPLLADEGSPMFMAGAFESVRAMWQSDTDFRTATSWQDQPNSLSPGLAGLTRPVYRNFLLGWLGALGMTDKLREGAEVADVGCGEGLATRLMAKAFPASVFRGWDYLDGPDAESYPGGPYDLICFLDSFHDMGDPLAVAKYARQHLRPNGKVMVVEPQTDGPLAALMYAGSAFFCVPTALAQGGQALGNQAGEEKIGAILTEAGFQVEKVAETPFNYVLGATCPVA